MSAFDLAKILATAENGQVIYIPPGEHQGPFWIDRPIYLTGSGRTSVLWAAVGPVVRVESQDVVLENLSIEVADDKTHPALMMNPQLPVKLSQVRVIGKIEGMARGQIWDLPEVIDFGVIIPGQKTELAVQIQLPGPVSQFVSGTGVLVSTSTSLNDRTQLKVEFSEDYLTPGMLIDSQFEVTCCGLTVPVRVVGEVQGRENPTAYRQAFNFAPDRNLLKKAVFDQPVKRNQEKPAPITKRIPNHIGIELKDGRMAVVVPRGEVHSVGKQYIREFFTSAANQRCLDIKIFEGTDPVARKNQLLGFISLWFPTRLTKGTPFSIGISLSSDQDVLVTVKLRHSSNMIKSARIHRKAFSMAVWENIVQERERLAQFIDHWSAELLEAEMDDLVNTLDQFSLAYNNTGPDWGIDVEKILSQVQAKTDLARRIRGAGAYLDALLTAGGRYLEPGMRDVFTSLSNRLTQARQKADWAHAGNIIQQLDEKNDEVSENIQLVIYARTLADQDKLSIDLAHSVYGCLNGIDIGIEKSDQAALEEHINHLWGLWNQILYEAQGRNLTDDIPLGIAEAFDWVEHETDGEDWTI